MLSALKLSEVLNPPRPIFSFSINPSISLSKFSSSSSVSHSLFKLLHTTAFQYSTAANKAGFSLRCVNHHNKSQQLNRQVFIWMSNSTDEITIPPKAKRGRNDESENVENRDRLSDLPDGVLLHVLSFLGAKDAVRTCVLSTRWKHLWKRLPTLILRSSDFSTLKNFAKFVSMILSLRDGSVALQGLDFCRYGSIQPHLLKKVVNFVVSQKKNVQRLGFSVECDIENILPCFFSSQTLTSLELYVSPKGCYSSGKILFPKSLNLPALTILQLENFAFCASDDDHVEPFSAFIRLNSLILHCCTVRDAQTLCISSATLVNLTMRSNSSEFSKIELFAPSLCSFAFTGNPHQKLCGSHLSSVTQVSIDAEMWSNDLKLPLVLLGWLLELSGIKSLTVTTTTLRILDMVPDLLEVKLPSLCYLKSLKVKARPLSNRFFTMLKAVKLKQAVAKSRKEAAKLLIAFKAGWPSSPIPDGILDFLLQNSPSSKVDIIDFSR